MGCKIHINNLLDEMADVKDIYMKVLKERVMEEDSKPQIANISFIDKMTSNLPSFVLLELPNKSGRNLDITREEFIDVLKNACVRYAEYTSIPDSPASGFWFTLTAYDFIKEYVQSLTDHIFGVRYKTLTEYGVLTAFSFLIPPINAEFEDFMGGLVDMFTDGLFGEDSVYSIDDFEELSPQHPGKTIKVTDKEILDKLFDIFEHVASLEDEEDLPPIYQEMWCQIEASFQIIFGVKDEFEDLDERMRSGGISI